TVTLGFRRSSIMHGTSLPQAAKAQVAKPAETGFYAYTRNWSRDKTFDLSKAPQRGDTPLYFLLRRVGHAYEVWPLYIQVSWVLFLVGLTAVVSFMKAEVWLDRSKSMAPWDWSRVRDNYWKTHTILTNWVPVLKLDTIDTHRRLEIMEKLQDEMLEAAKKRGTRT
ncbi:hypothetical protein PMAYCL1PPCAC_02081, partial [Pristionchus mayeri]